MSFIDVFNNREKAILIWGLIFLGWCLTQKSLRKSFFPLFKILFLGKVGIGLLAMVLYVTQIVFLAYKTQLWDTSMLKDTIIWFLGTAFIMFINMNDVTKESNYFRKVLLENLKFGLLLEFIINLYVFNLIIELILVPVILIVAAMIAFSENKKEYAPVKKVLNVFLSIIVLFILCFTFIHIFDNFKGFATIQNLKSFLLSPLLTIAFLPFIYFLALYSTYESLFVRVDFCLKEDKALARFTKWKILWKCLMNLKKLNVFSKKYSIKLMSIKNKSDVTSLINQFKDI